MNPFDSTVLDLRRHTDLVLAGLVVSVIVMMALPLPSWSLDVLVAANITAGVSLLLTALFIPTPLAFSTFPSVLLITTLFRISLNVATTRQILLHANGGEIIETFGRMVVGGSLVVGLVVFAIITVVQFIVIAKGAERVAEVGARFTLDALPGKQMSIDADLRAGVISQIDAMDRRRHLVEESHFYGSMDGAMKFVKGDAIAGIVIVAVNLLGGMAIGTLSLGMSFVQAIQRFSVLSIGDGLVSQIPALFVSIAAGITITRATPDSPSHLADQIGKQLAAQPRALLLSSGVVALFALVPGFPTVVFLVLATASAWVGVALTRRQQHAAARESSRQVPAATREGETAPTLLRPNSARPESFDRAAERAPSAFRIEFSLDVIERFGVSTLNDHLAVERALLRERFGIPFPGLVLQMSEALLPGACVILVQDLPALTLSLPQASVLVAGRIDIDTQTRLIQEFGASTDAVPEWLLPAVWISESKVDRVRSELTARGSDAPGLEFLDPMHAVARLITRTIQRHPEAALGVQEVKQMIQDIEWRFGALAREAQAILPLGRLADLMAALARERVPLADFPGLLQAVVTHAPGAADTHTLYEAMRLALSRGIVASLLPLRSNVAAGNLVLPIVTIDPAFEARLHAATVMRPDGPVLALPPPVAQAALESLIAAFGAGAATGVVVLALPSSLRRGVSRLFRAALPRVAFLSYEEISAASITTSEAACATLVEQGPEPT